MRILIATSHRSIVGGVETYVRAVLADLAARGHDLALVYEHRAPAGATVDERCLGIPAWCLTDGDDALAAAERWRPDVVYAHGLADPDREAALARRFPTVWFAHNYEGTCVSGSKCHSFPTSQPCTRTFGPACLALYLPRRCGGLNPLVGLSLYRTERRRQRAFLAYRAVVIASRRMRDEYARHGIPADRLHLIPLCRLDVAPDPEPPGPRPATGRVLFVGRVTALKGWRPLLDALSETAVAGLRLTLVVAGDGPDRMRFEAEANRRGLPATFLGWVEADRVTAEMRAADVLAVPSVWPEPYGLVGVEAGCVGLPTVAFAVGGIPDWLTPGVSGELAPGERPDQRQLADALVRALADESHWQRLRVGAWETARRLTAAAHMDRLIPILEAAAGSATNTAHF
jgi:glycosyltransferase involved in cell wall biosynthesis